MRWREYFARVDTRRQLSGTLRQCHSTDSCVTFLSPVLYFTRDVYVRHPLSLLAPTIVKIAKHFMHSEHSRLAVQKFTRHESSNYFIWPTRFSSYEMGSLYWANMSIIIFFFFTFCARLCASVYIYKRYGVHPTLIHVNGNYSALLLSRRKKPHTSAQAHVKNYIAGTIYFRLCPLIPQTIRICSVDFLVQFHW